jgi:hypothetical protein
MRGDGLGKRHMTGGSRLSEGKKRRGGSVLRGFSRAGARLSAGLVAPGVAQLGCCSFFCSGYFSFSVLRFVS